MSLHDTVVWSSIAAVAGFTLWPQIKNFLPAMPWSKPAVVDEAALDEAAFARLLARAAVRNPEAAKALIDMRAKLLGGAA